MNADKVYATGFRFFIVDGGKEVAHAYLYLLRNDLHGQPFGFLEDVFVDAGSRGTGAGRALLQAVMDKAREEHCYKLIATSRDDGSRENVHHWYLRLGFKDWGTEFRMEL